MAGKRIDHSRVRCARLHGLPNSLIAERLNCSKRQVRRINQDLNDVAVDELTGTEQEWISWKALKTTEGYSIRRIAFCFCMSHEHVRQILMKHYQEFKIEEKEAA